MSRLTPIFLALAFAASSFAQALPEGKGKDLLEKVCSDCHGADSVVALSQSRDAWKDLVNDMVLKGASASADQLETIVDYLATNFPAKVRINKATAKEIAEGLELTQDEADAIVKYHQAHGDFRTYDALTKVDGVDKTKLEAKKTRIAYN